MAAKRKERNELEYYKGKLRELKSQVRNLKKSDSRNKKKLNSYDQFYNEDVIEEDFIIEKKNRCPDCTSFVEVIPLGNRDLWLCEACGFQKTFRK